MVRDAFNIAEWDIRNLGQLGQELVPVDSFSKVHSQLKGGSNYTQPLPLTQSRKQYAFKVDVDQCSGCKACVAACHSFNGLDEGESWRSVGTLVDHTNQQSSQFITTSCHHCVDPACMNGCPTLAYEKDPQTGIVKHLDDQCIGCQYCVWKCPYDAPKFNKRLGIVRKCDLCTSRLAVGELPACAQACPNGAIKIEERTVSDILERVLKKPTLLPGLVASSYTQPSTIFSGLNSDKMSAPNTTRVTPSPIEWSLVLMLFAMQCSAGLAFAGLFKTLPGSFSIAAAALILCGIGFSTLHLGRPMIAWKAVLGWRKSWLSREVITFGAFASASIFWAWQGGFLGALAASVTAIAGLIASSQVYVDTRRPFWNARGVYLQFVGTALLSFGVVTTALSHHTLPALLACAVIAIKLIYWARESRPGASLSSKILREYYSKWLLIRHATGLTGGILLSVSLASNSMMPIIAALLTLMIGELVERALFFAAVVPFHMPGARS